MGDSGDLVNEFRIQGNHGDDSARSTSARDDAHGPGDYAARKGSKEKSLAVVHRVTHAAPEHPLEREPVSPQQGARWSAGDAAREPACASPSAIRALKLAAVAKVIGKPRVGAVEVAAADSHGNDPGGDEQRQKRAEQKQTRRPHHPAPPSADRQGSDPLHVGAVAHPRNGGHER